MDFEDFVLRQPLSADTGNGADGECGGTKGDSFTIKTSTRNERMVGFNKLCGTLTGQHSKLPKVNLSLICSKRYLLYQHYCKQALIGGN